MDRHYTTTVGLSANHASLMSATANAVSTYCLTMSSTSALVTYCWYSTAPATVAALTSHRQPINFGGRRVTVTCGCDLVRWLSIVTGREEGVASGFDQVESNRLATPSSRPVTIDSHRTRSHPHVTVTLLPPKQ